MNSLLQENPTLPISGVIFLSPIVNFINPNKNSLLHRIASKINLSIFDDLQISSGINPTALSKSPSNIKKKI